MDEVKVPRRILGTLLSSLSGGVVPRVGAPYIAIGRTEEIEALTTTLDRVRDGEGATKLLECIVKGAPDENTAKVVAKSVISSSLVKAAMFAADANWGRILCAIGYAKADFDITKVSVELASEKGKVTVCTNGAGVSFSEESASEILSEDEIKVLVDLHCGEGEAIAWGCDLTFEYVKINAEYRT